MAQTSLLLTHSSSSSPGGGGGGGGCPYFGGIVNRKQRATQLVIGGNRWPCEHTLPQASYPALMSVLLTLQVTIGGRVRTRRAWGEFKVKSALLRRRCNMDDKIWWLNKCNFVTEKPS
jgi:hypothetical protein